MNSVNGMKACLVMQRRFAYIGHELALLMKESGAVDQFCGYVILRDSYDYLRAQKDIEYTSLILDEDIQKQYAGETLDSDFLEAFERDHGSVWSYIGVDRVLRYGQLVREYPHNTSPYSNEELLKMVQVYVRHITLFLEREKPDFIFTYSPGALGMLLLYSIAKKKGIPVINVVFPFTRNRIAVSELYGRLTWVEALLKEREDTKIEDIPHYAEAKMYVEEFRERPVIYSKVYASLIKHGKRAQFSFLLPKNIHRSVTSVYGLIRKWIRDTEKRSDYTTVHPLFYIYDRTKRKLRNLVGADDLYDVYEPERTFVFYPLHYEPELAIYLLSPYDHDQLAIIRRIAQSVPAEMLVYVKEHPQMTPYRPRAFYKELKKIPNVRLLRPEISGFDIIAASSLVTVISGAAGWEATLLGKPVITFGTTFYNAAPSTARSITPEQLPELIKTQLGTEVRDDDVVRFLSALFEDSVECDLLHIWERERDRVQRHRELKGFAELIARKAALLVREKSAAEH